MCAGCEAVGVTEKIIKKKFPKNYLVTAKKRGKKTF